MWKTYVTAILAILLAVGTCVYCLIDGNDQTNPDISGTVKTVTENVQKIRDARAAENPAAEVAE